MKKLIFLSLLFSYLMTSISFAQTLRNDYKKIDYLLIEKDQISTFLKIVQNELKSSYQQIVDSGDLKSWCLYKVQYPGGKESSYTFINIATTPDLNIIENSFSEIGAPRFVPSTASTKLKRKLGEITTIVKSELWKVENLVPGDSAAKPSQFMTMDYMNVTPGKNLDYLMLEDEVAKPIHRERMSVNRMAGWEVYSLISPGGTRYGYNFATGNYFDKLEHVEFGFTNEVINQAMGDDTNIPELFTTICNTRDLVKIELWKLAAHTE
jgi:hypothetical protein